MFYLLLLGAAVLLTTQAHGNVNLTCYECKACNSTSNRISTNNRICFRIQMNCPAADVNIIDLTGDAAQTNYSSLNCGHTRVYSAICTVAYQCCYTNRCNTYENPPVALSSSSSLSFRLKRIVVNSHLFFALLFLFIRIRNDLSFQ